MRYVAVVASLLMVAACVPVTTTMLNPFAQFAPVEPERVRIFTDTAELAEYDYERVAILNASGDFKWVGEEDLYKAIREKAGAIGANAVLLASQMDPSPEEKVCAVLTLVLTGYGSAADRKAEFIAIFVRNPDWQ